MNEIKDKKCRIFKSERRADSMGGGKRFYREMFANPLWCYTRQISMKTALLAGADRILEYRLFILNYRPEIKPQQYIKYKNDWYEIQRVDTKDGYNTDIYAWAERVSGVKDSDLIPFSQ